jgi:hypothetical protein
MDIIKLSGLNKKERKKRWKYGKEIETLTRRQRNVKEIA